MADDQPGPCRPETAVAIAAAHGPVEPRPDRGQQDGEQGRRDGDAHERDREAPDPDRAQRRNGQRDKGEQRDRHRRAAEDGGRAGPLQRPLDGDLVADPAPPLLAPAHHYEERVVDREPEADQHDQELDGDRHLGDLGERPDDQEGGRDRNCRHQQRHERD